MGIVRKQSIQSSILFYIGAAIGFGNKIILFTKFLSEEEVGLANILLTTALMYAQFSALGIENVNLRFFPYFRDKPAGHHNFLLWLLVLPLIGFAIVTALMILLKPLVVARFSDNSPLLVEYYYYLIPFGLATLYFNIFENYLRSLYKTVVPTLFKEVFHRLGATLSVLAFILGWVTFPQFVALYVALLSAPTLLMILYTAWLGHLRVHLKPSWRLRRLAKRMLVFGLFNFMGNISVIVIWNIDSWMIADYLGMDDVGIYTTCFFATALMLIPWRALQKIASPQVAELWRENNMVGMDRLYKRTSIINHLLGMYLFVMLIINTDLFFSLMPPSYAEGWWVLFFLGLARLIEMVTGLNGYIIVTSKHFRYDMLFNALLMVFIIVSNLIFIPWMGMAGSALATALSLTLNNIFRVIFLWYQYKLQPFTWPMLVITLVGAGGFVIQYLIPDLEPLWLEAVLRSIVFTAIYAVAILLLKVSDDANRLVQLVQSKARERFRPS